MRRNDILNKMVDTIGVKKTMYVLGCCAVCAGIGLVVSLTTMDKIFEEKEN